jgi:hypothetical protein
LRTIGCRFVHREGPAIVNILQQFIAVLSEERRVVIAMIVR